MRAWPAMLLLMMACGVQPTKELGEFRSLDGVRIELMPGNKASIENGGLRLEGHYSVAGNLVTIECAGERIEARIEDRGLIPLKNGSLPWLREESYQDALALEKEATALAERVMDLLHEGNEADALAALDQLRGQRFDETMAQRRIEQLLDLLTRGHEDVAIP